MKKLYCESHSSQHQIWYSFNRWSKLEVNKLKTFSPFCMILLNICHHFKGSLYWAWLYKQIIGEEEKPHPGKVISWKGLISESTSWKRQSSNYSWTSTNSYTKYHIWNNLKQQKSLKQKKNIAFLKYTISRERYFNTRNSKISLLQNWVYRKTLLPNAAFSWTGGKSHLINFITDYQKYCCT